jgi:hypothetical protein
MTIDLQKLDEKIDAKIAKMHEVRRIIRSDPEMASLLAECLSNEVSSPDQGSAKETSQRIKHVPGRSKAKRGGLKETVFQGVLQFKNDTFDVNKVFDWMVESGFRFKAKKPKLGVGIELRKLEGQGKIELVERGSGSTPSIFRYPPSAT